MDSKRGDKGSIAASILATARTAFSRGGLCELLHDDGDGRATREVKQTFGKLGLAEGFKVCAAGFHDSGQAKKIDGEWLYDMLWYEDDDNGMLARQVAVFESEWKEHAGVKHNTDVDGDFQKLVQARADVRVWVSTSHNSEMAREHIENCKKQVRAFAGTESDDTYIFVINDWSKPDTLIEQFVVP